MHETTTTGLLSPPALLYLGIGLVTARILIEGASTRGLTWLEWLQLLIKAMSITLLWPLVLFLEKFEEWLKDIRVVPTKTEVALTKNRATLCEETETTPSAPSEAAHDRPIS